MELAGSDKVNLARVSYAYGIGMYVSLAGVLLAIMGSFVRSGHRH